MKGHKITRLAIALLMGVALMLSGVSTAATKTLTFQSPPPPPPANDNFANATLISALPFTDSVDNTWATTEPGEPQSCYVKYNTVWYTFTPETAGVYKANTAGSSFDANDLTVYWAEASGLGGLRYVTCASWGNTFTFVAQAGRTYYFQAGSIWDNTQGTLHFNLEPVLPPPNDNWAHARVIESLSYHDELDATGATLEPGEPTPGSSCTLETMVKSIWYSYMPGVTGPVSAHAGLVGTPVISVYTGNTLDGLQSVACRAWDTLTFRAEAGTIYYFQVATSSSEQGLWTLNVEVTPPPEVNFGFDPWNPTVFDTVAFHDSSWDPGGVGIESESWDLGDGTTATGCCPTHRYARDGDYTVKLTVTTLDGRTASTSRVVPVGTHDVAIVRLGAPQSASARQTRHVTVDIKSNRYPENVRVELYKSVPGGFQPVGTLTNFVPVRPANRTTQFDFSYTFTADDARIGKVTFKAVATILPDIRDALPADNEAISSPTKVGR